MSLVRLRSGPVSLSLLWLLSLAAGIVGMPRDAAAQLPDSPGITRREPAAADPNLTPAQRHEAERIARLPIVNGRPYDQPSDHDKFLDYLRDSYELPAFARATVQALYAEGRGKPTGWGQDAAGFGQRYGSALAVQAINGNVRFASALIFHEDLRYIPCHGCSKKRKIQNALLAEITARHGEDGHRFFTLTQTVADFSGPIIAH